MLMETLRPSRQKQFGSHSEKLHGDGYVQLSMQNAPVLATSDSGWAMKRLPENALNECHAAVTQEGGSKQE